MSFLITRMKGQKEIFCQPTVASIFDREPQIATRATGRRPLFNCKWLVSPVWFRNFGFLGMSANPELTSDYSLYLLAVQA